MIVGFTLYYVRWISNNNCNQDVKQNIFPIRKSTLVNVDFFYLIFNNFNIFLFNQNRCVPLKIIISIYANVTLYNTSFRAITDDKIFENFLTIKKEKRTLCPATE